MSNNNGVQLSKLSKVTVHAADRQIELSKRCPAPLKSLLREGTMDHLNG